MFDIVSSLGPQSQVLHPTEASVFVQSSIPSTRSAIDTYHKYLLLYYTFTNVALENSHAPATGAHHPSQVLIGSCPAHNPLAPDPKIREKGPLAPAVT